MEALRRPARTLGTIYMELFPKLKVTRIINMSISVPTATRDRKKTRRGTPRSAARRCRAKSRPVLKGLVSRVNTAELATFVCHCHKDVATDRWASSTEIRKAS
jgi:hypothetical protein